MVVITMERRRRLGATAASAARVVRAEADVGVGRAVVVVALAGEAMLLEEAMVVAALAGEARLLEPAMAATVGAGRESV